MSGAALPRTPAAERAERADDYAKVLNTLRKPDSDVRLCVRTGSHVYGTATEKSDRDFLVVIGDVNARQDLVWGENLNIVVHTAATFVKALEEQSVFAFEALFAPEEHQLKPARPAFAHRIQRSRLFESAKARSDSDWAKAQKKFDDEPEPSKKRVLHALRVLAFARQLAETGTITDFRAALPWWHQIHSDDYATWPAIASEFGPIRAQLLEALSRRGRR